MIARVQTATIVGHRVHPVQVEVDILPGAMGTQIVGLADNAVKESRDRIRSAITRSGFHFPVKQIIVNLAPNELPKEGGMAELAIAVAILMASGQLPAGVLASAYFLGSLSLDGVVQPARGMVAAAIHARQLGVAGVVVSRGSVAEVACIPDIIAYPLGSLADLNALWAGEIEGAKTGVFRPVLPRPDICMSSVQGQEAAKAGLAYAAIGGHHTILLGPPGSGKTMLARAFEGILPPLTLEEALEVTEIYSLAGLTSGELVTRRMFRSPHHTTSDIAIIGGGSQPSPGEVSLAHRGVLFFDEMFEFGMSTLQALREPLEDSHVTVSRARAASTFPADFIFLGATNPCRCGYFTPKKFCTCSLPELRRLYQKVVGPFLDRMAIEIEVLRAETLEATADTGAADSAWWREKVTEARRRMYRRNGQHKNQTLPNAQVLELAGRVPGIQTLLRTYSSTLRLSHRSVLNSLRLAISIMDFQEKSELTPEILEEAFDFRRVYQYEGRLQPRAA